MHPLIQTIAQQTADTYGIRLDIARDDADAQRDIDECEFVQTFLLREGEVEKMLVNCTTIEGIKEYLVYELDAYLSDLRFERDGK